MNYKETNEAINNELREIQMQVENLALLLADAQEKAKNAIDEANEAYSKAQRYYHEYIYMYNRICGFTMIQEIK